MNPLASYLDVAVLNPELTPEEVLRAVEECLPFQPCSFCVRPSDIPVVQPLCREHRIGLCVVLGFPHGCQLTETKAEEARCYIERGVDEIDMVCNVGWVRSGDWDRVRADISAVSAFTRPAGVTLKVIFETCLLTDKEIRPLVDVCVEARADFVKTSTGFNGEGARDAQVKKMIEAADHRIQVKPSGGIRDPERARSLIKMGAARLGVGYRSVPDICAGDALSASAKS